MKYVEAGLVSAVLATALGALGCNPSAGANAEECQTDADCPTEQHCVPGIGVCAECTTDAHCDCHSICKENVCTLLGAATPGLARNAHGIWSGTPGEQDYLSDGICKDDNGCGIGEICNPLTGGCLLAADFQQNCPASGICRPGPNGEVLSCARHKCLPVPTCNSNHNCCNGDVAALACDAGAQLCRPRREECTPPAEVRSVCPFDPQQKAECGVGLFCAPWGQCIGCVCDEDCGSGLECYAATSTCVPQGYCTQPAECDPAESCDTQSHLCTPRCSRDADCDERSFCNTTDHVCRPLTEMPCGPDEWDLAGNGTAEDALANAVFLPVPDMDGTVSQYDLTLCGGDVDWYVMPLHKGDRITIDGTSLTSLDATMVAYAADASTNLATGGIADQGALPLDFTVSYDDLYYVEIRRNRGTGATSSGGYYDLAIKRQAGVACNDAFEQSYGLNNVVTQATRLNRPAAPGCVGAGYTTSCAGVMSVCPGDVDYYVVEVGRGDDFAVEVGRFAGNLDLIMYGPFADPAEARTGSDHFADASFGGSSTTESVDAVSRSGGFYLVQLRNSSASATSYDLQVTVNPALTTCDEDAYDALTAAAGGGTNLPAMVADLPGLNDTFATASWVALAENSDTFIKTDASTDLALCRLDQDWFRLGVLQGGVLVDPPAGDRIEIELQVPDTSPSRTITVAAGHSDTTLDAGSADPLRPTTRAYVNLTDGGPYYVAVLGPTTSTERVDYALRVFLRPPPACSDDGHGDVGASRNDSPATALALAPSPWNVGATYALSDPGLTLCALDNDWYKVSVPTDARLIARVRYNPTEADLGLALYDAAVGALGTSTPGTPLGTGLLDDSAIPGQAFQRVIGNPATSEAYVQVYNRTGWPMMPYELELQLVQSTCFMDFIDASDLTRNDSAATAYPVSLARASYDRTLDAGLFDPLSMCTGEVSRDDWFKVRLLPGDRVVERVYYDPGEGDLDLLLYEPLTGMRQIARDTDNALHLGVLKVEYTVPATGPSGFYLTRVQGIGTVSSVYQLETQVTRACTDDAYEPATADGFAGINSSTTLNGVLCNDVDWYNVHFDAPSDLSVCATFLHSLGDIDLELFSVGVDGSLTPVPNGSSATKSCGEQVALTGLAAGDYRVELYLDPRDQVNTTYQLAVDPGAITCPTVCP